MGPNCDPWIPLEISPQLDGLPLTITLLIRLDSQFLIHLIVLTVQNILCWLSNHKILFSTVWNALLKPS